MFSNLEPLFFSAAHPGTPEMKHVDGKKWHWCLSHRTATHKDPSQLPPLTSSKQMSQSASAATAIAPSLQFVVMSCLAKNDFLAGFSSGFIAVFPLGIYLSQCS